ncbi:hypothetical protein [Methanocrinis sp.]|uniref:hypothetical protein n=1 Tax=Methanocrinis sp. TaxID=3101522 RepID=UPI003D13E709
MRLSGRGDVAVVAILAAYGTLVLATFWDSPYFAALLLLPPPIVLGLILGDPRMAAAMGLSGSILGPLTEMACVAGGLWTYANTGGLPYVPPWNFPIWACFPPAVWLLTRALLGTDVTITSSPRALPLALAGIGAEIAIFVSLGMNPPLALAGGAALAAAVIFAFRERATLAMMGTGALLGPICESLPIAAGAWWYAAPVDLFGMPAYMILAYSIFGGLVGHASKAVGALLAGGDYFPP